MGINIEDADREKEKRIKRKAKRYLTIIFIS